MTKSAGMKIYVDAPFEKSAKDMLRTGAHPDTCYFRDELEEEEMQRRALLEADILFGNPKRLDWLQQASHLKWIQFHSTGFEYYRELQIPAIVTNMRGFYAEPCAETIVAGLMALYRGIDRFSMLKRDKHWVGLPARSQLQLLQHKKVIVLGWGSIGKRVAKILEGFDCEVFVYSRSWSDALVQTPDQLVEVLPTMDVVVACLPGTDETRGFFTAHMIRSMRPTAVFCNVGRGNLLEDEGELIDALMQGRIGGAVLDVTAVEPLPASHPLWDCPNTILSQHTGGGHATEHEGMVRLFLENLQLFKEGKPLKNQVQLHKGY